MKYFALTGLLILAAVLALGWRLASQSPPQPRHALESPQTGVNAAAIGQQIVVAKQLNAQLNSIAARAFEARSNSSLIAFTKTNEADMAKLVQAQEGTDKPRIRHARVSLLYSGADFNRAVVDGKYVRRGDRLPNGGRVLRITENSVLVRSGHRRHVLHVPDSRRVAK